MLHARFEGCGNGVLILFLIGTTDLKHRRGEDGVRAEEQTSPLDMNEYRMQDGH